MNNIHRISFVISSMLLCSCSTSFNDPLQVQLEKTRKSICEIHTNFSDGSKFAGSGILIKDGLVLTAYHLFDNNKTFVDGNLLFFNDISPTKFNLIAHDKNKDLAILSFVSSRKLECIKISTNEPHIGDSVYNIAFQNGISISTCEGLISNPNKVYMDNEYIEVSIASYPGCSGSPILNKNFECVGIVSRSLNDRNGKTINNLNWAVANTTIIDFLDGNNKKMEADI